MLLGLLIVAAIILLIFLNRKGHVDDGEFAVAIVLILSAVGWYIGVSQY